MDKEVIITDNFDEQYFEEAKEFYPASKSVEYNTKQAFPGNVFKETFQALNKTAPKFNEVGSDLEPVKQLLEMAMKTPSFNTLKKPGELLDNIISSATITPALIQSLPNEVKKKAAELTDKVAKQENAEKELQAYMDYIEALKDSTNDYSKQIEDINKKSDVTLEKLSNLQSDTNKASQELSQELTSKEAQIQNSVNQACENVADNIGELKQFIKGFSLACGGNGKIKPDVARQAMELFRKKPNVLEIAKMLGYLKKAVVDKRTVKDLGNTGEISEFRRGKLNIGTMAPQEVVRMVAPERSPIKIDFNKRAFNNNIQNVLRESERPAPKGKGPLIIIRDESGSMHGTDDELAKGIEWALLEIAQKEKRAFYSIPFAGYGQHHTWTPPKKIDPKNVIEHFSHNYGGGTEPYSPLIEALKIIKKSELKSDILIITDGYFGTPPAGLMEKILEMKSEFPLKIFTVLIGTENEMAKQFSDKVIKVNDLWNDKYEIAKIIAGI